ncbi:MAG: hypothetical protein DMF06_03715 [Verrucomicrobia bacterium]|nr:MAG: hypothetical protein DMF06_03715 [Verrucomicrobiota bacterium]
MLIKKILTKNPVKRCDERTRGCLQAKLTQPPGTATLLPQFARVAMSRSLKMPAHSYRVIKSRPPQARFFRGALSTFFLVAFAVSAPAVDDIPPPFGFHWNDSMTKVEQVLVGAKSKIITKERKEKRNVWTVEGLVQPGLKRTLFTFKEGFLVEVELQYEYPDWSIERYNDRMGEIRRYFDAKFGTGKLVSRSRDTDSDVIQTLVGYQWIVNGTMLELFYFSAQRDLMVFRSITVTYKAI